MEKIKKLVKENNIVVFIICLLGVSLGYYRCASRLNPVYMAIAALILYGCALYVIQIWNQVRCNKRFLRSTIVFSVLWGIMMDVGSHMNIDTFGHTPYSLWDVLWIFVMSGIGFVLFAGMFGICVFQDHKLLDKILRDHKKEISGETPYQITRRRWLMWAILLIAGWIPFFLLTFPGNVPPDATYSIGMSIGAIPWDNHYPVAYSLFVGVFLQTGMRVFGRFQYGVAMYTIVQMLIMGGILSYLLCWMEKYQLKKWLIYGSFAYFTVSPAMGMYMTIMWKDPMFSGVGVLLILFLLEKTVIHADEFMRPKNQLRYFVLSLLFCFLRNNGIYVIAGISIVLLILYRKYWKRVITLLLLAELIPYIITGPVYVKTLGAENLFVEKLGVPLQQMARVVVQDGTMTEEQADYLNQLLPLDEYQEYYNPYLVDPVKWAPDFDSDFLEANKKAFFTTWMGMMGPNMKEYINAYLMDTYGFWYIPTKSSYESYFTGISPNDWGIYATHFFGENLENSLWGKYDYISMGLLIWLVFALCVVCFIQKKTRYIVPLLPLLGCWGTLMLATPTAFGVRYILIYVLALPILVGYPMLIEHKN